MIIGNLLSGLTVSSLIFIKQIELVYLCVAGEAVFLSIIAPARQGLVPQLVSRENLSRANALLQQLASLIKVFGPMIGAMVVGLLGPNRAVILDVISFFASAGLLSLLLVLSPAQTGVRPNDDPGLSRLEDAGEELPIWSVLWSSYPLRLLFLAIFLSVLAIMGLDVLSSVYTRDVLQADEAFFGIFIGSVGLGSVFSGLYLLLRKTESNPMRDFALGLSLLAVLILSLVMGTLVNAKLARVIAIGGSLIGGWGNGLVMVQGNTILQTFSPSALIGRLAGLFQSTLVAGQLVSLLLTPLIVPGQLSIGLYLFIAGIVLLLLSGTILLPFNKQKTNRPKGESIGAN